MPRGPFHPMRVVSCVCCITSLQFEILNPRIPCTAAASSSLLFVGYNHAASPSGVVALPLRAACGGDCVLVRTRNLSRSRSASLARRPRSSESGSVVVGDCSCSCCWVRCRRRISMRSSTEACRRRWRSRIRDVRRRSRVGPDASSCSLRSAARGGGSWASGLSPAVFSGRRSRRLGREGLVWMGSRMCLGRGSTRGDMSPRH